MFIGMYSVSCPDLALNLTNSDFMLKKANSKKPSMLSAKRWVSVVACFSFLFLVAISSFSSMDMSSSPMEHSGTSDHQEISSSLTPHNHNIMDHDMTDAGCMSFQCHAIAMLSIDELTDQENPSQNHDMISYSLDSAFLEGQKRPPRHV